MAPSTGSDNRAGELRPVSEVLGVERVRRADPAWLGRDALGRTFIADEAAFYAARNRAPLGDFCETCRDAQMVRRVDGSITSCPACVVPPTREEIALRCGFNLSQTFVSFVRDDATREMLRAAGAVATGERWCAFLRASYGTGKTHLANAAGLAVIHAGGSARFWSMPVLIERLRETQRDGAAHDLNEFLTRYVFGYDLLVLDDLGSERVTPFAAEQTYRIIDHAYTHRGDRRLIVTTNVAPDVQDDYLERRVLDRLSPGEVTARDARSRRKDFDR